MRCLYVHQRLKWCEKWQIMFCAFIITGRTLNLSCKRSFSSSLDVHTFFSLQMDESLSLSFSLNPFLNTGIKWIRAIIFFQIKFNLTNAIYFHFKTTKKGWIKYNKYILALLFQKKKDLSTHNIYVHRSPCIFYSLHTQSTKMNI